MNKFPTRKTNDKSHIKVVDASQTLTQSDGYHGINSRKRKTPSNDDLQKKQLEKQAQLDIRTVNRVSEVLKAAKKGEYSSLSSLQDEVKEVAVGKMNKWEKRRHLQAKWESIGGTVEKQREGFVVKQGRIKANYNRDVYKYEKEKEMGLKGDNPLKRKEKIADEKRLAHKHSDPFTKAMNFHSAGRVRKDGMLTFNKSELSKVHNLHKRSRHENIKLANVFK